MHITITGATGFVGLNLCPYLTNKGHEVVSLNLRESYSNDVFQHTDIVIHLAGKAHDTKNVDDANTYFEINTSLSQKLFDTFLTSPASDFIFFSSVKAAADKVNGILDEEIDPQPLTPNGKSKLAAEQYLQSKNLPAGKRLIIVRPCMIHGPNNKGNLNLLYKFVVRGIPYPLAAFENERSFLSIDNLNFLIESIISNKGVVSGVYNLADDEVLSTNQVVRIIATSLQKTPRFLAIPKGLLFVAGRLGDILKLPMNTERLQKLTENYRVANKKIKRALGITRLPVTAQQGLAKTINSFRSE